MAIKLDVPYYAQNDNQYWGSAHGSVQCCPTSNTMLLAYVHPSFVQDSYAQSFYEPECYYKSRFLELGYSENERGNHDAHTEVLESFGVDTVWRTDLTESDISKSLSENFPVVVGLEYKISGHICIVVGETDEGFLIHDPYGERNGTSNDYLYINDGNGDIAGSYDLYTWKSLNEVLFVGGGWGRLKK